MCDGDDDDDDGGANDHECEDGEPAEVAGGNGQLSFIFISPKRSRRCNNVATAGGVTQFSLSERTRRKLTAS